jgi:hypothetical protein
MMRVAPGFALVLLALSLYGAVAQSPLPTRIFEGAATTLTPNGTAQAVRVDIHAWEIPGQFGAPHQIPLRGLYVAHLLGGRISTTIDGSTVDRVPGDYWEVGPGSTMQVTVLGESAVLETIVVAKQ